MAVAQFMTWISRGVVLRSPPKKVFLHYCAVFPSTGREGGASGGIGGGRGGFGTGGKQGWCDGKDLRIIMQDVWRVNFYWFTNKLLLQVLRAQLELGQVRQEIDRRLAEKEEEFENTRFVQIHSNIIIFS